MSKFNFNVLVTGGCGFIGSNFCCKSYNLFKKFIILDSINYAGNINNIKEILNKENVELINEDICNVNLIEIYNKYDIDLIINFAAQTHVDNSYKLLNSFIKDNVLATTFLVESLRNHKKKIKLIHFSTDEIYGESKENKELIETTNFNPTNPYAATKASSEMIINSYIISFKLDVIIIRCNNVFGIKQHIEKVIPLFTNKALNNEELTIHGHEEKIRDFIHTDDVNNAVYTIINKGESGEIYNIGVENPIKILDLANYIIKKIGKGKITFIKDRPFNDFRYKINCDKLKSLGWKVESDFYEKLDEIIEWIRENKFDEHREIKTFKLNEVPDIRGKTIKLKTNILIVDQFVSVNKKNVLRGIKKSPYSKLITLINGSILYYVIDFSGEKPIHQKIFMSKYTTNQIYVPENFGHLFISLDDNTTILYQLEDKYNAEIEETINPFDSNLELDLPLEEYIIN